MTSTAVPLGAPGRWWRSPVNDGHSEAPSTGFDGGDAVVLVADPDPRVATRWRALFGHGHGFRLRFAGSLAEASMRARGWAPSLAILRGPLPDAGERELPQCWFQQASLQRVPLIVLTSQERASDARARWNGRALAAVNARVSDAALRARIGLLCQLILLRQAH